MLEHLPRWVHASIKQFIKENFSGSPIYFEGENDRNSSEPFYVEVRIDGPAIIPIGTRGEYLGVVEINLFLTVKKDVKYVHTMQDKMGLAMAVMSRCIPIKKIGSTQSVDDGSQFTVLQIDDTDPIDIRNLGQVDPSLQIQQASVESHYRMQLEIR